MKQRQPAAHIETEAQVAKHKLDLSEAGYSEVTPENKSTTPITEGDDLEKYIEDQEAEERQGRGEQLPHRELKFTPKIKTESLITQFFQSKENKLTDVEKISLARHRFDSLLETTKVSLSENPSEADLSAAADFGEALENVLYLHESLTAAAANKNQNAIDALPIIKAVLDNAAEVLNISKQPQGNVDLAFQKKCLENVTTQLDAIKVLEINIRHGIHAPKMEALERINTESPIKTDRNPMQTGGHQNLVSQFNTEILAEKNQAAISDRNWSIGGMAGSGVLATAGIIGGTVLLASGPIGWAIGVGLLITAAVVGVVGGTLSYRGYLDANEKIIPATDPKLQIDEAEKTRDPLVVEGEQNFTRQATDTSTPQPREDASKTSSTTPTLRGGPTGSGM